MTKTQWRSLRIGTKVTMTRDGKIYIGEIIRTNSNGSQMLVRWDGSLTEIWYGRLGIELLNQ